MTLEQYRNFILFCVAMAGGNSDDKRITDHEIAHYYEQGWDPISATRQIMNDLTNGEYSRAIEGRS